MKQLTQIYKTLNKAYGKQGWWPIINNKTLLCEYRGDAPKDNNERFEICVGAILTQNTAWLNVEKALVNLKKLKTIDAGKINRIDIERLKSAIKPAGYFNQKARKLKEFAKFYLQLKGKTPTRTQLLGLWGVGRETADSILLYAYKIPIFVVDAYTKRIFSKLGFFKENADYDKIRELFEKNLPKDYKVFQEFHALIVEHAKQHYTRKLCGANCPLRKMVK